MEKSNNQYKKALKYYYDGKIHKAMAICSKCLSMNPKDSKALSLKGMLLYFQGNLKEARKLWERNYKINGDEVAKKYLVDSRNDFEKMDIYDEAVIKMKEMKVDLAIKLLLHCKKSDFNKLNVDMKLIQCYMKKGEYEKLLEIIEEYKIHDKNNKKIREIEKELIKIGVKEKEVQKDMIIKGAITAGVVVIALGLGKYALNIINSGDVPTKTNTSLSEKAEDKEEVEIPVIDEKDTEKDVKPQITEPFDKEYVTGLIEKNNIDELKVVVAGYDKDSLDMNDGIVYKKAATHLENSAMKYYLDRGSEFYKDKDYENALKEYKIGMDHVILGREQDQELICKLVLINLEIESVDDVIKYTNMLYNNYENGGYTADTVYQTLTFLNERDDDRAKDYAKMIEKSYSDTIYMNDLTRGILN